MFYEAQEKGEAKWCPVLEKVGRSIEWVRVDDSEAEAEAGPPRIGSEGGAAGTA